MASAANSPVTLPSINEMFPEHMMHGLYDGRRDRSMSSSASIIKREPTPDYPQPSATPRPSRLITHVAHSVTTQHPEHYLRQNTSQPFQNYRNQRGPIQHQHHSYTAIPYHSADGMHLQTSQSYSLDLLRPNPSTSGLDTIATSHDVAYQPRPASSVYIAGRGTHSQHISAESSRSRPILRVDPPAASRDAASLHVIQGPSYRDMEHFRGFQGSAGYMDDVHVASPHTAGYSGQSDSRPTQSHVLPGPPYEEKKHCCPHCDKRFNRPSSLNIHVNTHTGAKPFICPYPGCQRRFNVNSNMRRHYRNHVSNSRRRDAVARLVEPTSQNPPPTPPLSASPTDTPVSHFSGSLPSSASSDASTPLPSRSSSPAPSYYSESDEAEDWFPNGDRRYTPSNADADSEFPEYDRASYFDLRGSAELGPGPSRTTRRQRSRSSPVPPSAHRQAQHLGGGIMRPVRPRSSSCNVPGCDCQPAPAVSTTLRPAFMAAPSARPSRSVGLPN